MSKHNQQRSDSGNGGSPLLVTNAGDDGPGPVPRGFQSQEAADADAQRRSLETADGARRPLTPGEVGGSLVDKADEPEAMCTVRSRKYIEPFRFGQRTFTLKANTPTRIPVVVRTHLEEKGLL